MKKMEIIKAMKSVITPLKKSDSDMRRMIFNYNASLIVLIVLVLVLIINLIAIRFNYRFDLTRNKMYSLSEQSIQAIKALKQQKETLVAYGFYSSGSPGGNMIQDLFKQYKRLSGKVDYRIVDPFKEPALAKQFNVKEEGPLVLSLGNKEITVQPQDIFQSRGGVSLFAGEQAITRTIFKLIDADTKNIYFMTGHGEKSYEMAREYIRGNGYGVNTLDLMKEGKIPEDCAEIVIAGPQTDITSTEAKILKEYMEQGGKAMIFLDYQPRKATIPNIIKFIHDWGIDVEDSVVIEMERRTNFDFVTIIPVYQPHAITNKLMENRINLLMPVNRALAKLKDYSGDAVVSTIIQSSNRSWAETSPRNQPKQDAHETAGPVPLGMASARPEAGSRLVVLGCSAFLDNDIVNQAGNLNFFYNITNWLLGQSDRISITPKQMELTRVSMLPMQILTLRWFVLIILPLAIFAAGGFIWLRRRKL